MPGTLTPLPWLTFFDGNGNPYAGAKLFVYAAGTTTKINTYADVNLTVPNPNPMTLDSAGRTPNAVFLTSLTSYKFVLAPATDGDPPTSPIRTQDNISSVPIANVDVDVSALAGENLAAGEVAYLSDGSGGLTAGRWYRADADFPYSSVLASIVGMVPTAILSGATGTVRVMGRVTGLAGLIAGTSYYVSAAAGAFTSVAPVNARFVGIADSTTTLVIAPNPIRNLNTVVDVGICEGRLTLTSGLPVTTADVTAAGTVYFAPMRGNRIALYDGTNWNLRTFAELSLPLVLASGSNYDVFVYDNAGTPTLELGLAWTNDTTRSTALTVQDGVYVKSGAVTRRYLGTLRGSGVDQTEDSFTKRFLFNYYNRALRAMRRVESTDSWAYTTATWRQANGAVANQLAIVVGVAEEALTVTVLANSANGGAAQRNTGIGEDSSAAPVAGSVFSLTNATESHGSASFVTVPAVGYHFYTWLEHSQAAGATTWYGDNGGTIVQSGMAAQWRA